MKTRIVIMKPDHQNAIFLLNKKKNQVNGKQFTYDLRTYLTDDDHFQLSTGRKWYKAWLVKEYYTTYYYAEGSVNPLPVPAFKDMVTKSGVEGEELAALFNPWFYRTIAAPTKSMWDQMQFYMNIATLAGVAFLVYKLILAHHDPATAADAAGSTTTTTTTTSGSGHLGG